MPETIRIKRYSNRRLYDMNQSAYVTMDEVADMIRKGHDVTVVEAKTNEDITAYVLTQIVLEEAKKRNILLPAPLLHLTIRYGNTVLSDFFEKYLEEAIQAYVSYKSMADEQFKKWLGVGFNWTDMARTSMGGINPMKSFMESLFDAVNKKPPDAEKKEED